MARLGVDRLVLAIHQASFPASDDDLGHGTPCSARGAEFIALAARLGFTGIMLGPSGVTSEDNPSPYDGSALSRNPLHIAFGALAGSPYEALVDPAVLAAATRAGGGDRVAYRTAWRAQRDLLGAGAERLDACADARRAIDAHVAGAGERWSWLASEADFEAISEAVGHDDWNRWPGSPPKDRRAGLRFRLGQVLAHVQHATCHARARALGLRLYGDLAIGLSHRDRWGRAALFVPGYAMGAPPSRTNPAGQPWGYPVLEPDGPAATFLAARVDKLLGEHDGVRIDHPHGWVCPWVYRAGEPDTGAAVRAGARLLESPDLPDHPALAPRARVRPDQIDRAQPRHGDGWVRALTEAQIDRYAASFDLLVAAARAHGREPTDLVVEVLSTCPRPLASVLARHGLGRYRVTQKASAIDRADVYRSDGAAPADWIMVGNHDTAPLGLVVDGWVAGPEGARRAAYLAGRLAPSPEDQAAMATRLERDGRAMATAMIADLFVGPARHVQIFWPDLFGSREIYNRPGVVDGANWSMRVPAAFEVALERAIAAGEAPHLGEALALALAARGLDRDDAGRALAARLTPGVADDGG